jgi:hypothetical protein
MVKSFCFFALLMVVVCYGQFHPSFNTNDCFPGCNGCSEEWVCDSCLPGNIQWAGTNVCRPFCPLGSHPIGTECSADNLSILSYDLSAGGEAGFSDTSSGINAYLRRSDNDDEEEDDDEEDEREDRAPIPVAAKGYTFNGYQAIQGSYPFLLPSSLTISTWIKPYETVKEAPIFAKGTGTLNTLVLSIAAPPPNQTRATTLWMTTDFTGSGHRFYLDDVEMYEWQHLALTIDYQGPNTLVKLFVNGVSGIDQEVSGILYDELSTLTLGATFFSSYVGGMYNFEVFNYVVTDFSGVVSESCLGECGFCPADGNCIEADEDDPGFVDATGAQYFCGPLCEACSSTAACDRCVEGTFPIPGTNSCGCMPGQGFDGETCTQCFAHCASCSFSYECTSCAVGSYLWPAGNFCRETCPFGSTLVGAECVAEEAAVLDFQFDRHNNVLVDKANGV